MTQHSAPLWLPPRKVTRDLEYEFDGTDGLVGVYSTYYDEVMPIKLRDLTLGQRGTGKGTALRLAFPLVNSVNEVTAYVDDVLVRPHPTLGTDACWENGPFFENCWNLRLNRITVHGDNARHAPEKDDPTKPFPLHAALRFKNCQDVKGSVFTLYGGMEVGIDAQADVIGGMEGLVLDDFDIVHARVGVRVISNLPGNLPTPWAAFSHFHVYHHATGFLIVNRSEVTIHDGNIYCSDATESGVGVYLIGGRAHKVHDVTIWNLSKHGGHAIVVDDVDGAIIHANTIYSNYVGIWLTRRSRNCKVYGNTIEGGANGPCPWPIVDHGVGNQVQHRTGNQVQV